MASAGVEWKGAKELIKGINGAKDSYQRSCRLFKMHVLEHER